MTNKLKYFIGNWKMFGDFKSIKIIKQVEAFLKRYNRHNKKAKVVFCIPNTLIDFYSKQINSKYIPIGAQNCHDSEKFGPFTGSVSAYMLKKSGAKYVILGHSENRSEGETNKVIKQKIESAHAQNLKIIFCIGESKKERRLGKTFQVLRKQIKDSIVKGPSLNKTIFAYEPIWSIGTGKILKGEEIKKIIKFLKFEIKKIFKTKKFPIILYGGSVNDKNVSVFSQIPEIDGFLIGSASQSKKKFVDIMKNYYK